MLESLANVGEFAGGIAVIVSLVYLAIQIRGNTKAVRAQAVATWHESSVSDREAVYTNPEVAELLVRLGTSFEPSNPEESLRFGSYITQLLNSWEMLYVQSTLGLVDEEFLESKSVRYTQIVAFPGVRKWWTNTGRDAYIREFVEYVDGRLSVLDDAV